MITVAEINSLDELDPFRLLWKSLWQKTRSGGFFQTLDAIERHIREKGDALRPKILVAYLAGRPIGIVPFAIRQLATEFGPLRVLGYPTYGPTTLSGPIGPNPAATLITAVRYLADGRRDWDAIDLRGVDVHGTDRGRTQNALKSVGLGCRIGSDRVGDAVHLGDGWNDFWSARPVALRRSFHNADRALADEGPLRYERLRSESPFVVRSLRERNSTRGASRPHSNFRDAERCADFRTVYRRFDADASGELSALHAAVVNSGLADVNVLRCGHRVAAIALNACGTACVENIALAAESPKAITVLLGRMLRDGADRGDVEYRFPLGTLPEGWNTAALTAARYTHFARTAPRAQMLRLSRSVRGWFGGEAKAAL